LRLSRCRGRSTRTHICRNPEKRRRPCAATCAITSGFIHLSRDSNLFDKHGVKVEFVSIRGSGVALAALAADEIQYLCSAADATISGMASGSDAKLMLVGLPWVMLARGGAGLAVTAALGGHIEGASRGSENVKSKLKLSA
jgi:hypothetical protein